MNTVVYRCTKKCASKTVFLPHSRLDSWKQIQTVKLCYDKKSDYLPNTTPRAQVND